MQYAIKVLLFCVISIIFIKFKAYFQAPPLPELGNKWWAHGIEKEVNTSIFPFEIHVPREVIADLRSRLNNTRPLIPPLEGIQQQYGINTNSLRPVLDYWINKYDWPARQKFLNQFPHFTTNIQGLNIHFIRIKPTAPSDTPILPLLMLHGWPSSFREFYKIIPILTTVHKTFGFTFELVVPSLPGFGFSDGAAKPGFGAIDMSVVLKNLMLRVGFDTFYVQGTDWGAVIVTHMATLFPQHILGLHTNMATPLGKLSLFKVLLGSLWPSLVIEKRHQHKLYPLSSTLAELIEESGYCHLQATKPDTIGVAISDSPAGIAAYFLEKISTGTRRYYREREDAALFEKYTYEDMLDNFMIYWVSNTITTSMRIYAEGFSKQEWDMGLFDIPVSMDVPCAVAKYPDEIFYHPDWILRDKYPNLVHSVCMEEGGHFPALEMPDIFAEDLFTAFNKMRQLKR